MTIRPSRTPFAARWTAAAIACALFIGGPAAGVKEEDLPPEHRQWLQIVDLILTKNERASFLELEKDYQRDAFIEEFWRTRDPYPSTARNEFKERWLALVDEALVRFGGLDEDRAEIFLLNGPADAVVPINCINLWPAEVWWYERPASVGTSIAVLFYNRWGTGHWVLWQSESFHDLLKFPDPGRTDFDQIQDCRGVEADALTAVLASAQRAGILGYPLMLAEMLEQPEAPSGEWVNTFRAYSTEVPEGADTFPATLTVQFPGRKQSRTVVQAVVTVPREAVGRATIADVGSYNLLATGEILRDDRLFENFRYRFNLAEEEITGESIPLVIERNLRPGPYTLVLKIEDLNSEKLHRIAQPIEVPAVDERMPPPPPADEETRRLLEEAQAALSATGVSVQIVPPRSELITGLVRIDTLVTGDGVAAVTFDLDGGEQRLTKNAPPYSVELAFGNTPRLRRLVAIARDSEGRELDRDVLELNTSPHRFAVELVEPRPGQRYEGSVRAEVQVEVPADQAVDRVELYVNDQISATLYQPPWVQQLRLPPGDTIAYVSAKAIQPDGAFTEDLVYVNAPDYLEDIDVQFVELYVSVLDRDNRPVLGLDESAFTVTEDDVPQSPTRFDEVTNLPIHAGILLDISASMEGRLDFAQQAALKFFQEAVTPRDRATLITFNDRPNLAAKFTNEVGKLAGGLAGLKAERGTALYDSLVFSLHYFNGVKGQRALVVLSDGEDEQSRFPFEDALDYARRAGVAIYAVGLDLGRSDARRKLARISEETGGRAFFIDGPLELDAAYADIQRELRSRYYLAYQSTNTSGEDDFRIVDVKLAQRGLEAKTLRGYYP